MFDEFDVYVAADELNFADVVSSIPEATLL
jgi:hypothetical protein